MKITETDALTGETLEREATESEIAQLTASFENALQIENEKAAKVAAKNAVLDRLGITEDEAKLLLS